jgi:Tfp pilus assembly PilM family ATPase
MIVTLNIGTNNIRLLAADGKQIRQWAEKPLAPEMVKDGIILQPEAVATVIRELFNETKTSRDRVIVCLSGLSFSYRILDLPQTKPSLLNEAIDRAMRREIPLALEELYLSWQKIGSRQGNLDYFVLGVSQHPLDLLIDTLSKAGIKSCTVDLRPLALARTASSGSALIVSMETNHYNIIILKNGIPTTMHTLTPRGENASIEDNVLRLADEISRTVKFHNTSHPDEPLDATARFYLTGEAASEAEVIALVSRETGYTAEPITCPFKAKPDFPTARFSSNIGLALRSGAPDKTVPASIINIDILDGKRRADASASASGSQMQSLLLPLTLAVVIIALGAVIVFYNQTIARNNDGLIEFSRVSEILRDARLDAGEINALNTAISGVNPQIDSLQTAQQTIHGLKGSITSTLRAVTDALPAGTSIFDVQIGGSDVTISGAATDELTVVSYARALEARGFAGTRIVNISPAAEDNDMKVAYLINISR